MKKRNAAFIAILAAGLFASISLAQDEPIRAETNLVTLNIAVIDAKGNYVRGLSKDDFTILDNQAKQSIDTFSAEEAPVSFGIVYDLHTAGDDRTASVLSALREFTKELRPADDFFVSVFNEKGSLTVDFVPDADQIRRQIGDGSKTPNSLYDAIFAASSKLSTTRNAKKVLLVLTDGADNTSHHSIKELRLKLRSVNLPVYSMTFSNRDRRQFSYSDIGRNGPRQVFGAVEASELDRSTIAELSKTTGGKSVEGDVRNRVYLVAMGRLINEVRNQYVLGFYPDEADGRWHNLKVTVNGQKTKRLKLSSRKGYQSVRRQQ